MRQWIHGERDPRSGGARDRDEQQADRTASDDGHVGAEVHVAEVEGVDGHAQRLEHGSGDAVHGVGQRMQRLGRPAQVLAQAAVTAAVAREDDVGTEVVMALEAARAAPARHRRVDGDPPAVERPSLDDPRELVADDERVLEAGVPDPALLVPVQVRAADPHGLDAHEALPRSRRAHGLSGDAYVAGPVYARSGAGSVHHVEVDQSDRPAA